MTATVALGSTHVLERAAVNPIVRAALYLFVFSIPFEFPRRTIPLEIPTLTGIVFLLATLLHPSAAYRRIPASFLWFLGYLAWWAVSALVHASVFSDLVFRAFLQLGQVIVLLWAISNLVTDPGVLRGTLTALVAACALRAVFQIFEIAAMPDPLHPTRAVVLGQNANLAAMVLAGGLVAAVGFPETSRVGRALGWAAAVLMGIAIVQLGSRGGLLAAAVGLVLFAFRGRTVLARIRNGLLAVITVAVLAWGALTSPVMRARLEQAAVQGQLAGRERIYPTAVRMIAERPLLGWGPTDSQAELAHRIQYHKPTRDAHNLFLELLTSVGLLGAIPFLIGLGLAIRSAWRARRGPLGVLPLALLATVLTSTLSGTWLMAKILWLALAIALAAGIRPPWAFMPGDGRPV